MKLRELVELFKRSPLFERDILDEELVVHLSSPSIGPTASVQIESAHRGFDWNHGLILLEPKLPVVIKSDRQDLYDMSYELLHALFIDAYAKKRRPWYFNHLEEIYKRKGILEMMTEMAEAEKARMGR